MTVIVEYVVLDNFTLDLLVALLVAEIMRIKKGLCVLSAIVGTLTALAFPLIPEYFIIPYKILSLIACVLPLCLKKRIKRALGITALFVTLSAVFSGILQLFLNGDRRFGVSYYYSGGKIALISVGVIVAFYIIKQCVGLIKSTKTKSELVKIKLSYNDRELDIKGFIDGGNMGRFKGEGLNFLSRDLSDLLDLKEVGETLLETVNGKSVEKVYEAQELKIYYNGVEHIHRKVKVIKTDRDFMGFDVLLSRYVLEVDNDYKQVKEVIR